MHKFALIAVSLSIRPASAALSSSRARKTARRFPLFSALSGKPCGPLASVSKSAQPFMPTKRRIGMRFIPGLTKRINHQEAYSADGACRNDAESFFSRLRRSEIGIHHHIAGPYLHAYASEMAWREDNRRRSNGEQYLIAVNAALAHPISCQWKGYWQRC